MKPHTIYLFSSLLLSRLFSKSSHRATGRQPRGSNPILPVALQCRTATDLPSIWQPHRRPPPRTVTPAARSARREAATKGLLLAPIL